MRLLPTRPAVLPVIICLSVVFSLTGATAQSSAGATAVSASPGTAQSPVGLGFVVQDTFGGEIFGYDVDRDGTEGLFSEAEYLQDGNLLIATETFNPTTGAIIAVVEQQNDTQDNFVTLGIFGMHTGLRQDQHVQNGYVSSRTYSRLNTVQGNRSEE